MEQQIISLVAKEVGVNPDLITLTSSLQDDLGMDSLDAMSLALELEEEFNMEIPDEDIGNIKTVEDIVEYIKNRLANSV